MPKCITVTAAPNPSACPETARAFEHVHVQLPGPYQGRVYHLVVGDEFCMTADGDTEYGPVVSTKILDLEARVDDLWNKNQRLQDQLDRTLWRRIRRLFS